MELEILPCRAVEAVETQGHKVSYLFLLCLTYLTKGFLTFSGGIEIWHWTKMG